jgi:hypothetical protein
VTGGMGGDEAVDPGEWTTHGLVPRPPGCSLCARDEAERLLVE